MRTLTCDPNAEIIGANANAFVDHLYGEQTRPVLEKYGLLDVAPDGWMPTRFLLEALNDLAQRPNVIFNMVSIGVEVGSTFPLPPDLDGAELGDLLMAWGNIYQSLHRNGEPGAIECERLGSKHYATIHTDLFPDDFNYGIVYGYARRMLPPGTNFTVYYDTEVTPRDQGGDGPTIIHVEWE